MPKKITIDIEKFKKSLYKKMRKQHFQNIMKFYDESYRTEFDFNPKGKTFAFMLTDNTCFRL